MFVSLVFLILGMTGLERVSKAKKGQLMTATVVKCENFSGAKTVKGLNNASIITLEFTDENGAIVSTQMLGKTMPAGEQIPLYYDSGTQKAAGVRGVKFQYRTCVAITIFGAIALAASTIAVLINFY